MHLMISELRELKRVKSSSELFYFFLHNYTYVYFGTECELLQALAVTHWEHRAPSLCVCAHREPLPGDWQKTLDSFQRLLILRCLRADCMVQGLQDFVSEHMGQRFIEPQVDLDTPLLLLVFIVPLFVTKYHNLNWLCLKALKKKKIHVLNAKNSYCHHQLPP